MTERGSFLVRYDIRPEQLIEHLSKFSEEARERRQFYRQLKRRRNFLEERLCETYGIKEIRKQPGLPDSKMVDCLQRLQRSKILDNYPLIGTGIINISEYLISDSDQESPNNYDFIKACPFNSQLKNIVRY